MFDKGYCHILDGFRPGPSNKKGPNLAHVNAHVWYGHTTTNLTIWREREVTFEPYLQWEKVFWCPLFHKKKQDRAGRGTPKL